MGSERSSTVRQIRAGKICTLCRAPLPAPHLAGEQLCGACRSRAGRYRVYMHFMHRDGWSCHFLEQDLKTPLPLKLQFSNPEKVREMARRGGGMMNLESLQALDQGIEIGRGGVWLELTEEQYRKLQRTPGRKISPVAER